jgi:DNA-binding CsgD family transcriptional regulator
VVVLAEHWPAAGVPGNCGWPYGGGCNLANYRSAFRSGELGNRAWDISESGPDTTYLPLAVDLISQIGEAGYVDQLTRSLSNLVEFAHIGILSFSGSDPPGLLGTGSTLSSTVAEDAANVYLGGYYNNDPTERLRAQTVDSRKFLFAQRQRAEDIRNKDYRLSCYDSSGIIDRMSLFQRFESGTWIAVNIYRDASQGHFDNRECSRLIAAARILTASANKHRRLLSDLPSRARDINVISLAADTIPSRLAAVGVNLSKREFEVCSQMLRGYTAKEIARRLGIAPTSVVSHRQNAYAKLKVRDHKQLFALIIAH